jgi:formyl-CoA transferase
VVIAANADPIFARLCDVMGQPELAVDERFTDHAARGNNADALDQIIADWASRLTAAEIDQVLNSVSVVSSPIYDIADIAADPHFQAREMILRVDDPDLGELAIPGFVPKLSETPGTARWTGPAVVGQHNDEVYRDLLGLGDDDLAALVADGVI